MQSESVLWASAFVLSVATFDKSIYVVKFSKSGCITAAAQFMMGLHAIS